MCVSYLIYILNVRKKISGNISWKEDLFIQLRSQFVDTFFIVRCVHNLIQC